MAPISLGTPIAWGRTAELYAWKPGQVLKLFYLNAPASIVVSSTTNNRQFC